MWVVWVAAALGRGAYQRLDFRQSSSRPPTTLLALANASTSILIIRDFRQSIEENGNGSDGTCNATYG